MPDFLYVKYQGKHCRIFLTELQYLEAEKRYVRLVTENKTFLIESSLYKIESLLPSDQFCRIHKSYIISLQHAGQFDANTVTVANRPLPIGRHYRSILESKVLVINSRLSLTGKEINDLFNPPAED
ncbi:MAG: LytTR family transcriptional regulator [Chitinophagaceae bacterium]|nr:LytTR family transcriptional regulator [Chitinophagaceae bacterium]